MQDNLKTRIENEFSFKINVNQLREIERLIYEIIKRDNTNIDNIFSYLHSVSEADKYSGGDKFIGIKNALIKKRFPLTSEKQDISLKDVFLGKIHKPIDKQKQTGGEFMPSVIYIEKPAINSSFAKKIRSMFPDVHTEEIESCKQWKKKNPFSIEQLKNPVLFIANEKWDFVKPCPCTKGHVRCGYWIFNLGFGCPFDCTYCYLQQYSNFPGIILPSNIEDFFEKFDGFYKKLKKPIRIGTGEFCDSLALDHITDYSKSLIDYFRDKNVLLELKTKSNNIKNLLEIPPSDNIVISWSLNPYEIIKTEEPGTASLNERLLAAQSLQKLGYKIAFHFDPIIHFNNWEISYKELIDKIYGSLKTPFAWISIGTLRSNRELKTIAEQRFPESSIFYGELFIGKDKKIRYPEFLRAEIYTKIISWIKQLDTNTPLYLCMEDKLMWEKTLEIDTSTEVEKMLVVQDTQSCGLSSRTFGQRLIRP